MTMTPWNLPHGNKMAMATNSLAEVRVCSPGSGICCGHERPWPLALHNFSYGHGKMDI